jgi:hypothetical protein
MERIFRHGEVAYATECLITTWRDSDGQQQYQTKIKTLLGQHQQVFGLIPPGRPPDKGFEHTIELEEGAKPMITTPYRHPRRFKDEIEKAIKELLAMGHIRPNSSPFASSVVLVLKKDGGPLSHKQGGLIHQLGVWLGHDLKNGLLLLLLWFCNISHRAHYSLWSYNHYGLLDPCKAN